MPNNHSHLIVASKPWRLKCYLDNKNKPSLHVISIPKRERSRAASGPHARREKIRKCSETAFPKKPFHFQIFLLMNNMCAHAPALSCKNNMSENCSGEQRPNHKQQHVQKPKLRSGYHKQLSRFRAASQHVTQDYRQSCSPSCCPEARAT